MFLEKGIIFVLDRKKEKKPKNLGWWCIELLQEEEAFQQKILQVYDGFSYINKVMFQDFFLLPRKNDGTCWFFSSMIFHLSISIENYLQLCSDLAAFGLFEISQDDTQKLPFSQYKYQGGPYFIKRYLFRDTGMDPIS